MGIWLYIDLQGILIEQEALSQEHCYLSLIQEFAIMENAGGLVQDFNHGDFDNQSQWTECYPLFGIYEIDRLQEMEIWLWLLNMLERGWWRGDGCEGVILVILRTGNSKN